MSETFDISRLFKIIRLSLAEQYKILAIPFAIFLLLLIFANYKLASSNAFQSLDAIGEAMKSDNGGELIGPVLLILLILFLCFGVFHLILWFVNSMSMGQYHRRDRATVWLMMPCSTLEKFLAPYLLYVVILPLLAMGIVFGIEYITLSLMFDNLGVMENIKNMQAEMDSDVSLWKLIFYYYIYTLSGVTAFFLGSTFFKSVAFIKTIIVMIIISVVTSSFGINASSMIQSFAESDKDMVSSGMTTVEIVYLSYYSVQIILFTALSWFCFKRHSLP